MSNLTLTALELTRLKRAFAYASLLLALISSLIQWKCLGHDLGSAVLRSIPIAITGASLLSAAFYTLGWRLGPIAKWMGRPNLRGVWLGHLSSDYFSPEKTIPIVFVIRQTYLTVAVCSYTKGQRGESKFEALIQNKHHETTSLAYIYELEILYSGAQTRTRGTGEVRLLGNDILQGQYWTNTPTHGSITLQRKSTSCEGVQRFEDAVRKWPVSEWVGNTQESPA